MYQKTNRTFVKEDKEPFVIIDKKLYKESDVKAMEPGDIAVLLNKIQMAIRTCNFKLKGFGKCKRTPEQQKLYKKLLTAKDGLQNATNWCAIIRKEKNMKHALTENECFIKAAKSYLKEKDFNAIMETAKTMAVSAEIVKETINENN